MRIEAFTPDDRAEVRRLLEEYQTSLSADPCFRNFDEELAELPGQYAPPGGRLLVAWDADRMVGCIALRAFASGICEMKRLYVRPTHRGTGLGRRLASEVIAHARNIGYARMRLDTLPVMTTAIALYRALGFTVIPPYGPNPVCGAVCMELNLGSAGTPS